MHVRGPVISVNCALPSVEDPGTSLLSEVILTWFYICSEFYVFSVVR